MKWLPGRDTGARDLAVTGVALAGGALLLALRTYPMVMLDAQPLPGWVHAPAVVIVGGSLLLRRRAPLLCLAIGAAGLVADLALGGSLATVLIFTQVLYEACVHGPPATWRWLLRVSIGLTVAGTVAVLVATGSWRGAAWITVLGVLVLLFPVVTGLSVRQYRDQAEAERERAEQTTRLAELDRRQAVTAERHRMARELHDVIANHLSAVSIHATAAQAAGPEGATVREALAVIRSSAVQGLAEMRQMIRLLRDPGQPASPAEAEPTDPVRRDRLAEADQLVERVRRSGLPVRLAVEGRPRRLAVEVDLAAYRILQESLTNALKHGSGAPVLARVAYRPDRVEVTIENPLPNGSAAAAEPGSGAGAGLVGMRERAALLHGTLRAGPVEGAWRVHAELPAPPPAVTPATASLPEADR